MRAIRRQPFVDPSRIALFGVGTGAIACLRAAERDPAVAGIAINSPLMKADEAIARLSPKQYWMRWMRRVCKWIFNSANGVDLSELDSLPDHGVWGKSPIYVFCSDAVTPMCLNPKSSEGLIEFFEANMRPRPTETATEK